MASQHMEGPNSYPILIPTLTPPSTVQQDCGADPPGPLSLGVLRVCQVTSLQRAVTQTASHATVILQVPQAAPRQVCGEQRHPNH